MVGLRYFFGKLQRRSGSDDLTTPVGFYRVHWSCGSPYAGVPWFSDQYCQADTSELHPFVKVNNETSLWNPISESLGNVDFILPRSSPLTFRRELTRLKRSFILKKLKTNVLDWNVNKRVTCLCITRGTPFLCLLLLVLIVVRNSYCDRKSNKRRSWNGGCLECLPS